MATRFLVEGRVQGVGYRAWLRDEARRRGLRGTVRNLPDGRVEAVVIGSYEETDGLLEACREGPPLARVSVARTSATKVFARSLEERALIAVGELGELMLTRPVQICCA